MGIFDWKHWIVMLVVVTLVFGTKKLKHLGGDLGGAVKGFRKAMNEDDKVPETSSTDLHLQADKAEGFSKNNGVQ